LFFMPIIMARPTGGRAADLPKIKGCPAKLLSTNKGEAMSNSVSTSLHALSIERELDANIDSLTQWLRQNSPDDQAPMHADEGIYERLAWHTGYLIALRDIRAMLAAA
jgi:hypothetical protein